MGECGTGAYTAGAYDTEAYGAEAYGAGPYGRHGAGPARTVGADRARGAPGGQIWLASDRLANWLLPSWCGP